MSPVSLNSFIETWIFYPNYFFIEITNYFCQIFENIFFHFFIDLKFIKKCACLNFSLKIFDLLLVNMIYLHAINTIYCTCLYLFCSLMKVKRMCLFYWFPLCRMRDWCRCIHVWILTYIIAYISTLLSISALVYFSIPILEYIWIQYK